jgi:uncharacterized membrane protein YcaP (DUF421 family)
MGTIWRAAAIYIFLVLIFRVCGRRVLAQITTFDLVLVLIISEAAQQAMIGNDFSMTTAFLAIVTLVSVDVALSLSKQRFQKLDRWLDGLPLVLVENGKPFAERLRKSRIDESDILTAARQSQGLERMEQIKYAVLERSGGISIIPL